MPFFGSVHDGEHEGHGVHGEHEGHGVHGEHEGHGGHGGHRKHDMGKTSRYQLSCTKLF